MMKSQATESLHRPPIHGCRRLVGLALGWALVASPAILADDSPWQLLSELRSSLESSGPVTGQFRQTYVPAGFESGDTESGHLSIWLPRCLRWNYEEPENKSFLLCDDEVWSWTAMEPGGRHYLIEPEEEVGLDLLLVDVERLRERYVAESERRDDGTYTIALALPSTAESAFSARIHFDPVAKRVVGLETVDEEGNRTRFEIFEYQELSHTALFQPPKDTEWTEE